MSTDLVPLTDMRAMADAIAASQLFGLKTPQQALALMLLSQASGLHPATAARDFDIVQGRPAKKAEAMLRDFLSNGGRVEWHERSDERAAATFSHPAGGSVRIDWDHARAQKAGLTGKDNWKKYPRAMLHARCVSEGVRSVFPAATSGLYSVEEVRQMPPRDMGHVEEVDPATGEVKPEPPKAAARSRVMSPAPPAESSSAFDPAQAAEHEEQYLAMIAEATTPADIERHAATAKADWEPFGEAALPYYKRVRAAASARWRVLKANLETAASMTHGSAEKPATGPGVAAEGDWAAEVAEGTT